MQGEVVAAGAVGEAGDEQGVGEIVVNIHRHAREAFTRRVKGIRRDGVLIHTAGEDGIGVVSAGIKAVTAAEVLRDDIGASGIEIAAGNERALKADAHLFELPVEQGDAMPGGV